MPKYAKAQFVAFQVRPGVEQVKGVSKYLGADEADDDIKNRCSFMVNAIKRARELVAKNTPKPQRVARGVPNSVDSDPVLKIFMAPEFYFRNVDGAYPVEKLSEIMPKLREETDKPDYKDWLFVFGTAIGYLKHPDAIYAKIASVKKDGSGFAVVDIGALPHQDWVGATVESYPSAEITAVERGAGNELRLTLNRDPGFKAGDEVHFDPDGAAKDTTTKLRLKTVGPHPKASKKHTVTIEQGIQNPCPCCGHAYYVGNFDTCRTCRHTHRAANVGDHVHATTAASTAKVTAVAGRELTLDSTADYQPGDYVWLRRDGAKKGVTEIQNVAMMQRGGPDGSGSGLRSAVIYKEYVSQIDFLGPNYEDVDAFNDPTGTGRTIEIHDEQRTVLPTVGSKDSVGPVSTDPNIPGATYSWTDSKNVTHTERITEINKSGLGGGSVLTMDEITFGIEVCLDHLCQRLKSFYDNAAVSGDPKVQIQLIPSWGMSIKEKSICCVPDGLVFNVDGARSDSAARQFDGKYSCEKHPEILADSPGPCVKCRVYYCPAHYGAKKKLYKNPTDKCEDCNGLLTAHDFDECKLQQMGSPIKVVTGPDRVRILSLTRKWADYFENKGTIVVYETQAVPAAEKVT